MVHRRRETKGLNTDQVRELNAAWHHAARIGRPLNVMVSLRPLDIDAMTPAERCQLFAAFRNKLGVYARGRRFVPTYAWSREVHPDGNGEHMHVLMHVPSRHRPHFDDIAVGWHPGPGEVDITTANQRVRFTLNGKRLSAIAYIAKQMTPQAWFKRGLIRKAGGPIVGKRGGMSKNLNWRAQAAFRATWSTSPRPLPMKNTTTLPVAPSRTGSAA